MPRQATIAEPVERAGVGLHLGAPVRARLLPAPEGHGVRFVRMDRGGRDVPATLAQVRDTQLATTLGDPPVATVEHLLAATVALGIDNLRVEVLGPELPVLDGSAQPWFDALVPAPQASPARVLRVRRPVEVRSGSRAVRLEPSDALCFDVTIDFPHPAIGRQRLVLDARDFDQVARARTFGFQDQVSGMHAQGRALGGSLTNAVVFSSDGVLNPEGLRMPDEPVRHKTLDLFGDLALLGMRLQARVVAERPGHALTHSLLRALLADRAAYTVSD